MDGEKAEQLVRFRSYPLGDVQRVEVQQLFLNALAKKVFSTETITSNFTDLIKAAYDYLETDISITDLLKYAGYIKDIDINNMTMETLPGVGQDVNGVSYYLHDEEETKTAVQRIFFPEPIKKSASKDSKEKNIEVANGGSVEGLAARNQEMLEEKGYTVSQISTFTGARMEQTRIIVRNEGEGQDLQEIYPNSQIIVDGTELSSDIDIKIILGTGEK